MWQCRQDNNLFSYRGNRGIECYGEVCFVRKHAYHKQTWKRGGDGDECSCGDQLRDGLYGEFCDRYVGDAYGDGGFGIDLRGVGEWRMFRHGNMRRFDDRSQNGSGGV